MKSRQKKSRMHYYFWSAMTVIVFLGQLYVGTGYRVMAESVMRLTYTLQEALEN